MSANASPPIRIARVIARLNVGGPAIHTVLLTRHLRDRGFPSELLTGREGADEGNMLALARQNDVVPIVQPSLGRELHPLRDLSVLFFLYRHFRRTRPDVVHTHTAKAGAVGRVAAWMARVPVIVHTFHGHVFHGYFSPRKTQFFISLEKFLARISTRIIVLGPRQQQDIHGLGIGRAEQFVQVPLGLDLSRFLDAEKHRGALHQELGLPGDTPLVSIVARLVPIKAHEVFLQAARRVMEHRPDVHYLLAGDGSERQRLEALVDDLGLREKVRFLGFREDLPKIYGGSALTVLSSNNEGMPVALIESLASATPAVATDVGETGSIITNRVSGYVVSPGDDAALADRMLDVLSDPDRARQMGEAGRRHVWPALSIERLADDLSELYVHLVQEARAGR